MLALERDLAIAAEKRRAPPQRAEGHPPYPNKRDKIAGLIRKEMDLRLIFLGFQRGEGAFASAVQRRPLPALTSRSFKVTPGPDLV